MVRRFSFDPLIYLLVILPGPYLFDHRPEVLMFLQLVPLRACCNLPQKFPETAVMRSEFERTDYSLVYGIWFVQGQFTQVLLTNFHTPHQAYIIISPRNSQETS